MNKRYDFIIVGHVTNDTLIAGGEPARFTGGGAFFSAFAARRSGASVLVVTKLAEKDLGLLQEMRDEGIEVIVLPSTDTTSIENTYVDGNADQRIVKLIARGDPFRREDIPQVATQIYSLTGLFRGEIPAEFVESLSSKAKVGLDLQGMLRTSTGGVFSWQDWPQKKRYLPGVTFLKADSLESEIITGTGDRREAAGMLHEWGAAEVMITHSSQVILFDGHQLFSAPFDPSNLSGRTGRGDTCFMSYMSWRLEHGIEESLRYAAALTSIKMEKPGPFRGTRDEVLRRMRSPGSV